MIQHHPLAASIYMQEPQTSTSPKAETVQERLERLSSVLSAAREDQDHLLTRLQDVLRPLPPVPVGNEKKIESVPPSQCAMADGIEGLIEYVAAMRRDLGSALARLEI